MKRAFVLIDDEVRERALEAVQDAPDGMVVEVKEPARNLEQNAAMWPILEAFSWQLRWPVNGQMVEMAPEEWKDVLTAAFRREQVRLAMGLDGGIVMLGLRTSRFSKQGFSEFLDFLHATAIERGVDVDKRERR